MPKNASTPTVVGRPRRADAQHNYDRILSAAEAATAQYGADASLEEIARQAGVGSATLHRHFASRQALLEAVFHDRVGALCAQARGLSQDADPGPALIVWLQAVGGYIATTRGLAASLVYSVREAQPPQSGSCYATIAEAGGELLQRAQEAGAVRPEVSINDLLTLINGVSLATEQGGAVEVERLLTLALEGIAAREP